ncbi:MAG TPA: ATP-binding protein, partial [Candidatus Binataceae bacterium]|nr:ATP-binding protein [Candidatus Binataceae bacterium]
MNPPSLRARMRNGTLAMLVIAVTLVALALPQVQHLGGAIRRTLYRNYLSIEAAQHMRSALWNLQVAARDGRTAAVLPASRGEFTHWIQVERSDLTEIGEAALAREIDDRGNALFDRLAHGGSPPDYDRQFALLHQLLDRLIAMNRDAMFRADSRASQMSAKLAYEFAIGLVVLLLLGTALSWTIAWNLSKPLDELTQRLRGFSLRGPSVRLGPQALAELQSVATEFNRMAERLEQFEKLNIDRIIYEKSKTEAIIENLEDGIILIDPAGVVTHINEVAAIILGMERTEALGSPFNDLNSNHPHYLQVRNALVNGNRALHPNARVEVDLHVRGRDHTYVLKPVPLHHAASDSLGSLLILQDITYLRDKDRARVNLVATLSHELKTPLTSLALSAELLERDRANFAPNQRDLLAAATEDIGRIRHLADDLLNLARGATGTIALRSITVDLAALINAVVATFTLQAEQKGVTLKRAIGDSTPAVLADPIKLSWVISNLIANAIRYTPPGGTIMISSNGDGEVARLQVSDTGPGVAPEIRDHLFERYAQWQVNGVEAGSAGLGLAIAK